MLDDNMQLIDYERASIVSILRLEDAFTFARSIGLVPDHFTQRGYRHLYDSMLSSYEHYGIHDEITAWEKLCEQMDTQTRRETMEQAFAANQAMEHPGVWMHWITRLLEKSLSKKKAEAVQAILTNMSGGDSLEVIIQQIQEVNQRIEEGVAINEKTLEEQAEAVMANIEGALSGDGGGYITTGIAEIDRECGRFAQQEMIVVGARPSVGKSSIGRFVAMEQLKATRQPVAIFSLEMSVEQVVKNMAATTCGISAHGIDRDFPGNQRKFVDTARQITKALGRTLHIFDRHYTISKIDAKARQLSQGFNLGLIVVDYLQLVEADAVSKNASREQHVSAVSRALKRLAMDLRNPVMALAQLNRASEKDERAPRLSDLRESGSLEQDADRVWLLHRHKDHEGHLRKAYGLHQEKMRDGPTKNMACIFNAATTGFEFGSGVVDEWKQLTGKKQ